MRLVAGLDLGSTRIKLLVLSEGHEVVALHSVPTPWETDPAGAVVMQADALTTAVGGLLRAVAADLSGSDARIEVLAVTGMGESGFLLDPDGSPLAPAYAWFDRSGQAQVDSLPAPLRAEFAGRTGLPWGVQVSAAKIAYLGSVGTDLARASWLSLPEFVVHRLGGRPVAERSLVARTGLIDLDTGRPWGELLEHVGAGPGLIPPMVDAGTIVGQVDPQGVPAPFHCAELTVAGHDHLVSSVSADHHDPDRYHVSLGTAEVLLRVIDTPLTFEARTRLGAHLINVVPHVRPHSWVIVAGVKTGLLMRRALALVGAVDDDARRELDAAVLALPHTMPATASSSAVAISGARNDDGVLSITVGTDDISPALVMQAILEHGNEEILRLVQAIDAELPPATSALLTGGWTSWASVRAARSRVLPGLQVSERDQDTAYGAALGALALCRT